MIVFIIEIKASRIFIRRMRRYDMVDQTANS